MNDIRNTELIIVKELAGVENSYKGNNGKVVTYATTSIAVVRNPYKGGKLDFAVMPYYDDEYGDSMPLYTYQEDLQYQECRRIINDCRAKGKPVPADVDAFAREMGKRKMQACDAANAHVANALGDPNENCSTGFSKGKWRDIVITSDIAKELMTEAKNSLKKQTPPAQ